MAEAPKIEVNVVYLTEDQLRRIIREEIEHAKYPQYHPLPPYPDPLPWWQNPVIYGTGTTSARPTEEQVTFNG